VVKTSGILHDKKLQRRAVIAFGILAAYILLQFIWWEILLVRQTVEIIEEKQKLAGLNISSDDLLQRELSRLNGQKKMKIIMIVSEGTVFLLLLLFGFNRIWKARTKEIAINRQQKNFLLSVSHELKTPISATKLQLQTLKRDDLSAADREQLITNALQETDRLNALIDNVLLASRLEMGEFQFHTEKTMLSTIIPDLLLRYYGKEKESGRLKLNIDEKVSARIDPQVVPSLVLNLVDNALKYSPAPTCVQISLSLASGKALLTVKDEGFGVKAEDRAKIFSKFYRGGDEQTRSARGTGLGLFIVKYIADHQQLSVDVKDNHPSGSIFEVCFPAA
jgi:signal transduction histidine kinase